MVTLYQLDIVVAQQTSVPATHNFLTLPIHHLEATISLQGSRIYMQILAELDCFNILQPLKSVHCMGHIPSRQIIDVTTAIYCHMQLGNFSWHGKSFDLCLKENLFLGRNRKEWASCQSTLTALFVVYMHYLVLHTHFSWPIMPSLASVVACCSRISHFYYIIFAHLGGLNDNNMAKHTTVRR